MSEIRNKIITISGEPASGKSTVVAALKEKYEKLGYKNETLVQDTFIPRISVPAVIGVKNGVCIGVVEDEYILENDILHIEGSTEDKKEEYIEKLNNLFKKVKA